MYIRIDKFFSSSSNRHIEKIPAIIFSYIFIIFYWLHK